MKDKNWKGKKGKSKEITWWVAGSSWSSWEERKDSRRRFDSFFTAGHYVTGQPGVRLLATVYKHNTEVCGEGKRFLLIGFPIWGDWSILPLSQPHSQSSENQPPPGPESVSRHLAPYYLSFWSSWQLHKWVSNLRLSLSGVHIEF